MPATIPHVCPHCGHDNIVFTVVHAHKRHDASSGEPVIFDCQATCGACGESVIVTLLSIDHRSPMEHDGAFDRPVPAGLPFVLDDFQPEPAIKEPPRHLPDDVDKAMRQAYALEKQKSKDKEMFEPTVIMARKAVERAIGHIAPDLSGPLGARLKALRKRGDIPQSLLDWADEVKALGNSGAHDAESTAEDARQAVGFAEMFLTYAFTLPEEIRRRRKRD